MLNKVRYKLPETSLLMLYNAIIYPHLSYCNIIWGCCNKTNIDSLFKLQKRALRYVTGSKFNAPSSPIFARLCKLKLAEINLLQIATFMFHAKNHNLPDVFCDYFQQNLTVHCHHTRNVAKYHVINCRTNLRKASIRYIGPSVWNKIIISIREAPSVLLFKKMYTDHLLSFYT